MNTSSTAGRRLLIGMILLALALAGSRTARAQLPDSEERLKILTDPEDIKKKAGKDKLRPPIELFRSQVAPFDILPYVKPNHWSTLSLEFRSNYNDYAGVMQTSPVRLLGMPHEIVYRRDARAARTQTTRLGTQLLLPRIPKELSIELAQVDAIRPDEVWQATLRPLEPHQMLILFLTKEQSEAYTPWNRFQALYPTTLDRNDLQAVDRSRYFRLVLPLQPDRPPISSHPLTWTSLSHIVWDGMAPDVLNPNQQAALLDWLHWGGQLTLVGGAGTTFSTLQDSFLAPYLPAEQTGENALLNRTDLLGFSQTYPPPFVSVPIDLATDTPDTMAASSTRRLGEHYRVPVAVNPAPGRPIFLSGLKPRPGSVGIPLDPSSPRLVGVEKRVGRGRILMLALNPTDPALGTWPGLDTFVRRVVLRRPEESFEIIPPGGGHSTPRRRSGPLVGPDLTWFRYLSRDIPEILPPASKADKPAPTSDRATGRGPRPVGEPSIYYEPNAVASEASVGEWLDSSALPRLGRDALEQASGIKIPGSNFLLKVMLAYILALVPLNYLICRYVFRRREWAWAVVPILSLGFAVGVERAAAYDMGYNTACDEIDVLEAYGGFPRAHLTRFSSLYTSGRTRFDITYPDDPTALALPLDNGLSLRGEDVVSSTWQSFPVPALEGYLVQPRSLALLRSEQMATLDGDITLIEVQGHRSVRNNTSSPLRDAVVVEYTGGDQLVETRLGTIQPGASVPIEQVAAPPREASGADALFPDRFLEAFRTRFEDRPENRGEVRLVARIDRPWPGQVVTPAVDRHRGFTAVVVHLKMAEPPAPNGPPYNSLAPRNLAASQKKPEPERTQP